MSRRKTKGRSYKGSRLPHQELKSELLKYMRKNRSAPLSARQLIKRLKIANDKGQVLKALNGLTKSGRVRQSGDTYYVTDQKRTRTGNVVTGVVDMTRSGSAYVVVDEQKDDVFVRAEHLHSALNGDTVTVEIFNRGRRPSGEIVEVVKRKVEQFVGTMYTLRTYNVVVPDYMKVPFDIIVRDQSAGDAEHGDKVVVRITDWKSNSGDSPEGEITQVLGQAGSHDVEMQAILLQNGFDLSFPDAVMQEAKHLPAAPRVEDKQGRRDFRGTPTFTIDPLTAKDFDDALSIRTLDNRQIEVGIHIADVTHFVVPGSAIDKEAYKRSTSVYLVDRVAPMLPEELSNALCSLRPDEESLCFSAVFIFDADFRITDRWFGKTTIFSDRRFTYEEAQEVIETGVGDHADEILLLNKIAGKLRKDKVKGGALAFETDEVQFILDDEGVPIEVYAKERKEAHLLVEDFMLLANKEVAKFVGEARKSDNIPFVYRIHNEPDPDKLAELAMFARELGLDMQMDTPRQVARSFNALAEAARENEALRVLEPLAIRTMAKAEYNIDNIGHYGLAFPYYTHFTSPIRRYSDVLVHRLLYANIEGRTKRVDASKLQDQCAHISAMERKAQVAERDSIKFKQAEYMQQFIGSQFEGTISGMIDRGMFVKLVDNHAEGLVSFERLRDGYTVGDSRLQAVGNRTGQKFRMGDRVVVRIVESNPYERRIEMDLVEDKSSK